jgi:hypothetical protein
VTGRRIYPPGIAAVLVWLLDRFPRRVQQDVARSYWTPESLAGLSAPSDLDEFFP